ncbi:MAG: hypothetical protein IPP71_23755 [Bacteroidetes bacterium]|nr:hypothetical protein [Bacteroidota bacterium]
MNQIKSLLLLTIAVLSLPGTIFSQSFEKGNKVIDVGIKVSIYKVNNPDDKDDNDDSDGAASYTIPIGFEYALSDRIGAGIEIGICNYFTGKDTITGTIASANSFDVLFKGNFHWVRGGRVDLYSGLGLGFSSFKYESNDSKNSHFNSTGPYVRLSLMNARFYVSKAIAINVHIGIPYMNFENGRIEDDIGNDYGYSLTFTGFDIGTGLAVKF